MEVKSGYLLITDTSGYTEFLVISELQHAKEILDTLLQTSANMAELDLKLFLHFGEYVEQKLNGAVELQGAPVQGSGPRCLGSTRGIAGSSPAVS